MKFFIFIKYKVHSLSDQQVSRIPIPSNPTSNSVDCRRSHITPANQVVVFHVAVFAQINAHYFAPEQQPFDQHPAEGSHEEQMHQSRHKHTSHLQGKGQRADAQGSAGQTGTQRWPCVSSCSAKYNSNTNVVLRHCQAWWNYFVELFWKQTWGLTLEDELIL